MLSEARKQSMVWMETDYSKHTHFRGKIRWRLGHLGALGIMGEAAPLMFNVNKVQTTSLLSEQPTRESVGNNGWKSWEKCILTTIARMIKKCKSWHLRRTCSLWMWKLIYWIDDGSILYRCWTRAWLHRAMYELIPFLLWEKQNGAKPIWSESRVRKAINHKKCALMCDKFPKESI